MTALDVDNPTVRVTVSGEVARDSVDFAQFTQAGEPKPFDLALGGFKLVWWESSILDLAAEGDELKQFLADHDITSMEQLRAGIVELFHAVEELNEAGE